MPYATHPNAETPPDETRIWRYMSFTKFVSLLENAELHFSLLSEFEDPLEGFLTKATVSRLRNIPEDLSEEERAQRAAIVEHNLQVFKSGRDLLYVSSWHMNAHESAAMWRLYLRGNEGIAVLSSVRSLKDALKGVPEDILIGKVNYVDFDEEEFPETNAIYLALHKRRSFEHEREMRAIYFGPPEGTGRSVGVDVPTLLESVYLAPSTPRWVTELVRRVLGRYELEVPLVNSALDDGPIY